MTARHHKLIIIGSGPAGYSAAVYAARANRSPLPITGVEQALYLSHIDKHVTLVHRRDKLRAEKILQDRLFREVEAGKMSVIWNHTVDEVLGDQHGVSGVRLKAVDGNHHRDIHVTGLFI